MKLLDYWLYFGHMVFWIGWLGSYVLGLVSLLVGILIGLLFFLVWFVGVLYLWRREHGEWIWE